VHLVAVQTERQRFGVRGEALAERYLASKGWRVLDRRFRSGHRDIDLIVERNGVVAFVEVKTRRSTDFGGAIGAVDWRKQRELIRSARVWIDREGRGGEDFRFDVVGVTIEGNRARIRHVENAFFVAARG
jgi:putative endonuclease